MAETETLRNTSRYILTAPDGKTKVRPNASVTLPKEIADRRNPDGAFQPVNEQAEEPTPAPAKRKVAQRGSKKVEVNEAPEVETRKFDWLGDGIGHNEE
jgi:hypothetical protein